MKTGTPLTAAAAIHRILAVAVLGLAAGAQPASAQYCLEMSSTTLVNTFNQCSSVDTIERAFGTQLFTWQGNEFMVANIGNEIKVWSIASPTSPTVVDSSWFNVHNAGDSDYDLRNFSVCDDCRWGIANYKAGTILFDLGTGALPDFVNHEFYSLANLVPGAFTFSRNGHQYLIASTLPDECPTGDSTLYEITGIFAADLQRIGCVNAAGVAYSQVVGGIVVGDHLYLGDKTSRVFLYRVDDVLSSIQLTYLGTPMTAYMIKDKGLAVDTAKGIAIEANSSGMTVWDLSDPGSPVEVGNVPGDFNRAAVNCQYAFVARKGFKNSERTFDISDPSAPVPLDQGFWDPDHNWNFPDSTCAEVEGATFHAPTSTLFLSRYGVLQMAKFDGCGPCYDSGEVFSDGFETGSTSRWSGTVGGPATL